MSIVTIAASPTSNSRSARLLDYTAQHLRGHGYQTEAIRLRELPATELLAARTDAPGIWEATQIVHEASAVIIGTPIYKASFAGLLKVFLDLLPQDGLEGKVVLPLATGGSVAHFLALDYALRPVLAALGARVVLESVFVQDKQIESGPHGEFILAPEPTARLESALESLRQTHGWIKGSHADAQPRAIIAPEHRTPAFAI